MPSHRDGLQFYVHSPKSIVLIGFMGAGKSSVGRCLERRVGLERIDTDELIIEEFGMSIREIFARYGESLFRDAETKVLRELILDRPKIVITGGGTVVRVENVDLLKRLGIIFWLDGDEDILFERAMRKSDRPLLQTKDPRTSFRSLFAERKPFYAAAADIRIDSSSLTHEQTADNILQQIAELRPT